MAFLHPSCLLCFFVFPYLCLFLFVPETQDSITSVASKATFQYQGRELLYNQARSGRSLRALSATYVRPVGWGVHWTLLFPESKDSI